MKKLSDNEILKKEFDFKNAVRNPYAKKLKKQITIKLTPAVIDYFKEEAEETGIPYQTLINLYLTDCVKEKRKLKMNWR
ncbi:MAG: BrnA antitoxin family protein [Lachnospiraceae bacterium]|nr:BrnA antitoxin family protein [Lachnospiraceae bacterium]